MDNTHFSAIEVYATKSRAHYSQHYDNRSNVLESVTLSFFFNHIIPIFQISIIILLNQNEEFFVAPPRIKGRVSEMSIWLFLQH